MSLFQHTVIKKQTASHAEKIRDAYKLYADYFLNPEIQENIRNSKEEQFQEGFLRELFVKILGYTLNPDPDYNLITEKKNETNSRKADGAITINGEVKGVIELKDHKTTDLKQVETQAFGYKNYNRNTSYVVISNFEKLRFYIDNAIDFIEFNLFTLTADDFAVLWICLAYENIAKDLPKQLRNESSNNEDRITKQLYKDYSSFKRELFDDILANNRQGGMPPCYDQLTLFKKTQKLLDRLLFIFFAEDCGLLPPNSMLEIVAQWENLKELDEYKPLYERIKKYFGYMNTGFKGKKHDIFAYNGGLFKPDEILDSIIISDEVLRKHSLQLSRYDFASEVDVNILGHIFENSLSETEEITASITRGHDPLSTTTAVSKRKRDGVFYTPRYITAYIVENTLGKLCADKKTELSIAESEYFTDKKRPKAATKILADKLETYREWLLSLTICDPACGSGAFLNAALDFLMNEHRLIDEMTAKLFGSAIVFPNIENAILENNLYGVDINEESVEIARLALWLRTAKPQRKLNSLNDNIKCGNSLISSPPTPLHFGEGGPTEWNEERTVEIQIPSQLLANARELRKNQTKAEELLWQLLRGRKLNGLKFRRQHPLKAGFIIDFYCAERKLGIELDGGYHDDIDQQEYDAERTMIIKEYGINIIRFKNDEVLFDTENVLKRIVAAIPPSPVWRGAGGEEKAFNWQKEFPHVFEKGGFDVVIGNPPYLNMTQTNTPNLNYYIDNYESIKTANSKNLYTLFNEKSVSLVKDNGLVSFIVPEGFLKTRSYSDCVKKMSENGTIIKAVYFEDWVFDDATTGSMIFEFIKTANDAYEFKEYFCNKAKEIYEIEVSVNSVIEKYNKLDFPVLSDLANLFKGMAVKNREEFIFTEKEDNPDIFLLGNCMDRYKFKCKYYTDYSKLTIVGGTKNKSKHDIFPRILIRRTGNFLCCVLLTEPALTESTLYSCSVIDSKLDIKYLLSIINSKLLTYIVKQNMITNAQAFPQIMMTDIQSLKIPAIGKTEQQPFIAFADQMLSLNADLQTKRQRFLKRLSDNFNSAKITGTLEHFEELEFKQFVTELKKQKIILSLKQQDEWEEYFNRYKSECRNFVGQIEETDKEIDRLVYALYGLTEEEIKVIENK
jgi:very-short-patch-repair endonuclease